MSDETRARTTRDIDGGIQTLSVLHHRTSELWLEPVLHELGR